MASMLESMIKQFSDPNSTLKVKMEPIAAEDKKMSRATAKVANMEAKTFSVVTYDVKAPGKMLDTPLAEKAGAIAEYHIVNDEKVGAVYLWGAKEDGAPEVQFEAERKLDYEILSPVTSICLTTSGRRMADAKAVFNVELAVSEESDYDELLEGWNTEMFGTLFGSNFPGLIVKLFKYNEKTRVAGGTYLFESMEDLQGYVESDFWKGVQTDVFAANKIEVTMEMYNVTKVVVE